MHSSSFETERDCLRDGGEVLVAIAALVTEGRIPGKINKSRGFFEGPHCPSAKNFSPSSHNCNPTDNVCKDYEKIRSQVLNLWRKNIPVCVEVFLTAACSCENNEFYQGSGLDSIEGDLLLERWYFTITHHRTIDATTPFNFYQLISAVRSQLYFSQISAWLSSQEESPTAKLSTTNFKYRLAVPGETYECSKFTAAISKHTFPNTDLGNGLTLNITLLSLNRMSHIPKISCSKCEKAKAKPEQESAELSLLFDDRMHTNCTLKGKHRCEDLDDFDSSTKKECKVAKSKRVCHKSNNNFRGGMGQPEPSTSNHKPKLQLDIAKAELHREKKHFELASKNENEKRNSSPNLELNVKTPKLDLELSHKEMKDVVSVLRSKYDLNKQQNKDDVLLSAILRSRRKQNDEGLLQNDKQKSTNFRGVNDRNAKCDDTCVQKLDQVGPRSLLLNGFWTKVLLESECDNSTCDKTCERGDISNCKEKINIYVDSNCDNPVPKHSKFKKMRDVSNLQNAYKGKARQRITFEDFPEIDKNQNSFDDKKIKSDKVININAEVPSPLEQAKFRKSLDNAASMVFHSRTGLPLTSSPAPVRKGKCFDFDSSINSVSAIKSALFSGNLSTDDDSESDGSIVSPCSPDTYILPQREPLPAKYCRKGHAANLLGTFEESVLNGRLEPVSTVHGFTAELGASGSFVPRHLIVPVTVFFYTLGDNDKVSSPYLGHINLGRKGYNVPKSGTVQVTLFNPLGTVVKMFVIMYDLSDMPPNSQTFIRQRTLYMPTNCQDKNLEWGPKWLRYLIHLRFMSSKSGRIYLHSDIRMIIFRKSDLDTATAHGIDMSYELRSFTHMPANPKYSPRK